MFGGMEDSPRGREIKHVEGTPGEIVSRGKQIESLGKKMHDAATTLQTLKDNSLSDGQQQGKAIEKLQEIIGDSHEKLREAGDLYEPVGPVLVQYGESLEWCKPKIDGSANTCKELWSTYESLPGDKDDSTTEEEGGLLGIGGTDKEEATDNKAKKEAYENWQSEAEVFDTWYDVWEDAFDTATNGITDGTSGAIEDSWWSDAADILGWVAFAVGIIALVIGGPILGALALIVGVLYLVAVLGQFFNDEANGWDIFLAAVAIVPIGKLSTFAKLGHLNKAASKAALFGNLGACKGLTSALRNPKLYYSDGIIGIFKSNGARAGFSKLFLGSEGFASVYQTHKGFWGASAMAELPSVRRLAGIDFALTAFSGVTGHYANFERIPALNLPSLNIPSWLG